MQQLPFPSLLPESLWLAPRVCDLPSWKDIARISIDIESNDPDLRELGIGVRRDGDIIGVSFAFEDGPCFYLPWGHAGGEGNLDRAECLKYLADQAAVFTGVLTGSSLGYDLDFLAEYGVIFYRADIRDIQVAEPLLNEHRFAYGLDPLAKVYGLPGKDETLLRKVAKLYGVNPKHGLWQLPPKFVGGYAEWDAQLPLRILRKQENLLEEQGLWNIYMLECKLTPIMIKMRRRGVPVDEDRLAILTTHVGKRKDEMCKEINRHTPIRLAPTDLMKAGAIGPILEFLGIKVPLTPKTKVFSIDKKFLDSIDHPVANMIKATRAMDSMHSFCKGLPRYIVNGRIHATTNQLKTDKEDDSGTKGAVSGRCSMNDPSLHQQPIRHETLGAVWRGIYRPEKGCKWTSCDYAAQEPRLTIHYAEKTNCKGAKATGDRFRNNPNEDAYAHMMAVTGQSRKVIKVIVLGSSYGMGGAKLCDSLGYPVETKKIDGVWRRVAGPQGQAVIDNFHENVPFIRELARKCEKKAKHVGIITTILGRALHFEKDDLGNFEYTYKALNRLIQGGSADQMKKAMIIADQLGIKLQLQVHDELDFSSRSAKEAKELADAMRDAVPLLVPSVVDIESGDSWGEINEEGRAQCKEFYGKAV